LDYISEKNQCKSSKAQVIKRQINFAGLYVSCGEYFSKTIQVLQDTVMTIGKKVKAVRELKIKSLNEKASLPPAMFRKLI